MKIIIEKWGVFLSTLSYKRENKRLMKKVRKLEDNIYKNSLKINGLEKKGSVILSNMKRLMFYFKKSSGKQYRLTEQDKQQMKEWIRSKKEG